MTRRHATQRRLRSGDARQPAAGSPAGLHAGWWSLLAVLAVGLCVRLLHLVDLARLPVFDRPTVDAALYLDLAQRWAAASFLPREPFFKPPLYPELLAVVWHVVGDHHFLLRLPGVLAGTATCGVTWWLGRRLFGSGAGLLAGLLYALHRPAVYFEGELLEIGIVTLLQTLALVLVLRARPESSTSANVGRSWRAAALAGLALGAGTIARPTLLLFDAVALPWLGRRRALVALAGLLLVVLPITAHNIAHGGGFVIVSSNLGINYYLGNNPMANGRIAVAAELPAHPAAAEREARRIARAAAGHDLTPAAVSAYWLRRGLRFDLEQPGRALSLFVRKAFFAWNAAEISDNEDIAGLTRHLRLLRALPVGSWLLAPLGLVGLVLAPRRRDVWLLRGFVLAQIASLLPFFIVARFRLPWMPALAVLAAWTILQLVARLRGAAPERLPLLGWVVGAAVFCWVPAFGVRAPVEFDFEYKLGYAYQQQGRVPEAIASFREAIRIHPRNALAYNALGVLLADAGGDLDEARRAVETALELDPPRTATYCESLAGVLLRRGEPEDALAAGERGLRADPDPSARAALHDRCAQAYRALGDSEDEAKALRAALAAGLSEPAAAAARRRLEELAP